jgi:hypothetical protein
MAFHVAFPPYLAFAFEDFQSSMWVQDHQEISAASSLESYHDPYLEFLGPDLAFLTQLYWVDHDLA